MGIARVSLEPSAVLSLAVGHATRMARLMLLTMGGGGGGRGTKFSPVIALTVRISSCLDPSLLNHNTLSEFSGLSNY